MSPRARRSLLIVAAALVAWYVCVLLIWAVQPLSDAVPIGIDYSLKQPKQVSQTVDCNNLFSSSARDSSPLPTLNVQPVQNPPLNPLTYSRGACSLVQRDARIVFGLNTLFVLVALGGLVVLARRLNSHPLPPPLPSDVAPALTA